MSNLSVAQVKAAKHDPAKGDRPIRLLDGDGLYLQVAKGDTKSWLFRYTLRGKSREMGLGPYGDKHGQVSLKAARELAAAANALLKLGIDPIDERQRKARQAETSRKAEAEAEARTFRSVAELCIAAESSGWKNERTADMWHSALNLHAHPTLGHLPVAEIDRAKVFEAVHRVWTTSPGMARKVLLRIRAVLRYATAHGWRANDDAADPKILRLMGLPPLPAGKRQPSLPWASVPEFMEALATIPGSSSLALRFMVLTGLRSNEARSARWSMVSFDPVPTLTIPGFMMKGRKSADVPPHRVPLSQSALDVLARAHGFSTGTQIDRAELSRRVPPMGDTLIFPSSKKGVPLSDMSVSMLIRRMNAHRMKEMLTPWRDPDGRPAVPHGFRASFSTWVDDTRPEERESAERALAHEVPGKSSAAYRRSDLFDRRIALMEAWGRHCVRSR